LLRALERSPCGSEAARLEGGPAFVLEQVKRRQPIIAYRHDFTMTVSSGSPSRTRRPFLRNYALPRRPTQDCPKVAAPICDRDRSSNVARYYTNWTTTLEDPRGTGSHDCEFEDVVVPDNFAIDYSQLNPKWLGSTAGTSSFYRISPFRSQR
jgi:hypothetical protein